MWQNPLPQGNPLYSIHFNKDKENGFAVGADGTILRTDNGGFSWKQQLMPFDVTLSGVFVQDSKRAVIVGARGRYLSTEDGGKDWKQVAVEPKTIFTASILRAKIARRVGRSGLTDGF